MTKRNIKTPVYLDYQSTTPVDPRVLDTMLPWFTEKFGNPHSTSHDLGRQAAEAVEVARGQMAALINADPREVIYNLRRDRGEQYCDQGCGPF